jgi:N,N'-diacetyllegionaminate synthase
MLKDMEMSIYKIPSGEITNLPYLRHISRFGKEIILSTGMSDLQEVENALGVLESEGGARSKITVLHATTEYPCPMEDVNLKAMLTIQKAFGVKVGYSDHTSGVEVPIAAVALGACVIEKHFTLNRTMEGPDHKASLEPDELKAMVSAIRNIEQALGDGIKRPSPSELKNMPIARKSLVAICDIKKGDLFSVQNLGVKRPGTGISPMQWDEVIGMVAQRNFSVDEQIVL